MIDREKALKGLECCSVKQSCFECPWRGTDCIDRLHLAVLELLKEQSQWHPFDPLKPDDTLLKDHNYYLVTVKGFETPMKAKYHIDMPFGFLPSTRDFDPYDVIAWRELPDNMDEEVKHNDGTGKISDENV